MPNFELIGYTARQRRRMIAKIRKAMLALGEETAKNCVVTVLRGECRPLMEPEKKTPFVRLYVTKHKGREASVKKIFEAALDALNEDMELVVLKRFEEKKKGEGKAKNKQKKGGS